MTKELLEVKISKHESHLSRAWKWSKRLIIYPIVGLGLAGAITGLAEHKYGPVQYIIGNRVAQVAGNQNLGQVWQDYNEFRNALKSNNKKSIIDDGQVNLTNIDSISDFINQEFEWRKEFPDPTILKFLPYVEDNRITIKSSDVPAVTLVDRVTRKWVPDIPIHVKEAFRLKEDQNFYSHDGINFTGKMRAINLAFQSGKLDTAGSGITEQLAKLIMTRRAQLPYRSGFGGKVQKLKEMAYACAIEQYLRKEMGSKRKAKDKIMELYLNLTYFGDGMYGVGAASLNYFRKDVKDLSTPEALFLSVLPRNPGRNPRDKNGWDFQWEKYGRVLTNLDDRGIISREQRNEWGKWGSVKIAAAAKTRQLLPSAVGTFYQEMYRKYRIDLTDVVTDVDPAFGFEAELTASMKMVRDLQQSLNKGLTIKDAEAGSIVLDKDSNILAVLMARDNKIWANYNHATSPNIGFASTMKGILMAVAIEEGLANRYTKFNDNCESKLWCPDNWDRKYGRTFTLEGALKNSNNRIFAKVYRRIIGKIGIDGFVDYMGDLGFNKESFEEAAMLGDAVSLGARGGSPSQLAAAFLTIGTGEYRRPSIIKSLKIGGQTIRFLDKRAKSKRVFSQDTAKQMRISLGKLGANFSQKNTVYVGIKTGTASSATHHYIAGLFKPMVSEEEMYSLAILAVPTNGKKNFGNTYSSGVLGPIVKEFIRRFSSKMSDLSNEELIKLELEEKIEECNDKYFHNNSGSAINRYLDSLNDHRDQGNYLFLQAEAMQAKDCTKVFSTNHDQHYFFEFIQGVATYEGSRLKYSHVSDYYRNMVRDGLESYLGSRYDSQKKDLQIAYRLKKSARHHLTNVANGSSRYRKISEHYLDQL